jgi:hypothetical protein
MTHNVPGLGEVRAFGAMSAYHNQNSPAFCQARVTCCASYLFIFNKSISAESLVVKSIVIKTACSNCGIQFFPYTESMARFQSVASS